MLWLYQLIYELLDNSLWIRLWLYQLIYELLDNSLWVELWLYQIIYELLDNGVRVTLWLNQPLWTPWQRPSGHVVALSASTFWTDRVVASSLEGVCCEMVWSRLPRLGAPRRPAASFIRICFAHCSHSQLSAFTRNNNRPAERKSYTVTFNVSTLLLHIQCLHFPKIRTHWPLSNLLKGREEQLQRPVVSSTFENVASFRMLDFELCVLLLSWTYGCWEDIKALALCHCFILLKEVESDCLRYREMSELLRQSSTALLHRSISDHLSRISLAPTGMFR